MFTTSIPSSVEAATARLTGGLKNVIVPPDETKVAVEESKFDAPELPAEAGKVLALLADAQKLPASNKREAFHRQKTIAHISEHLHRIQQGPAAPVITSSNSRSITAAQDQAALGNMIIDVRRQFSMVGKYMDDLELEVASLTTQIEKLTKK